MWQSQNTPPPLQRPLHDRQNIPSIVFDDAQSLSSEDGDAVSVTNSAKKRSRQRTVYNVCYPPPKNGTRRENLRPLLQLHKVTQSARPRPTFDIVPSSKLSQVTRNEFTKAFSAAKPGLSSEDFAIVRSGEYLESEGGELEHDQAGHVLAIICPNRKTDKLGASTGGIFIHDGAEWTASSMSNGGYEFTSTNSEVATKLRWFSKRPQSRRTDSAADSHRSSDADSLKLSEIGPLQSPQSPKTFSCSTISPNSRRHPVVAKLSSNKLDIPDTYNMPPARPTTSSNSTSELQVDSKLESENVTTALRTLITATATWVALHEGWAPDYRAKVERPTTRGQSAGPARSATTPAKMPKEPAPKSSNAFVRFFQKTPKEPKKAKTAAS